MLELRDHSRVYNFSSPLSGVAVGAPPASLATCNGCHELLDTLGRHRAACTRSGRVKKRAGPTERVLARVCREEGAGVKFNAAWRDMNLGVSGADESGLMFWPRTYLVFFLGAQLAVDITLRSALCATGEPQPGAAEVDGAVLEHGATRRTHVPSWSFQGVAAGWRQAKAREAPALLFHSTALAWEQVDAHDRDCVRRFVS